MNIYVCVKHVPDTAASIRIKGAAGIDEAVQFVMNPYDEYAVEAAVCQKEATGGEVVAVTMGGASAVTTLRRALAVGVDRGILVINDDVLADSTITASALKAAIAQDGVPDLIFTGKQSVDTEGMQTHYRLAAAFGMPVANEVVAFDIEAGCATVTCDVGGGDREVVAMRLPCVIGATRGLNELRYPKLPDILKAKKKPIREIALADLGIVPPNGTATVNALTAVAERGAAQMIQGSVREAVSELVSRLQTEAKVL